MRSIQDLGGLNSLKSKTMLFNRFIRKTNDLRLYKIILQIVWNKEWFYSDVELSFEIKNNDLNRPFGVIFTSRGSLNLFEIIKNKKYDRIMPNLFIRQLCCMPRSNPRTNVPFKDSIMIVPIYSKTILPRQSLWIKTLCKMSFRV